MLDKVIEQMIKKGYGENFMNGDLVVAMIKDVLEIIENKKMMTAVDFLVETIDKKYINAFITRIVEQAKGMEKKETLKRQLFIGKVSEIIGAEKTTQLLIQVNNEII
jgi:hypothetical protein